jgi:hypothetical protein
VTLRSIGSYAYFPPLLMPGGAFLNTLPAGTLTFNSANSRLAWVGQAPITDTLVAIHFRLGNTTTGCTLNVRVESVSNGRPSGSLLGANTDAQVVVANTDDNVWKTATLTAGASLTRGNEFAVLINVNTGTPAMIFSTPPAPAGSLPSLTHYPLVLQDTGGGTWALPSAGNSFSWIFEFASAGPVYVPNLMPVHAGTLTTFNSGSTPNERAIRFQVPFKCRVSGARVGLFNIAAGANFTVSLWDASGTTDAAALAQVAVDGDNTISATQDGYFEVRFGTPVTLEPDTTYYLGVRPDTANNLDVASYANADIANALRALPVSADVYLATRTWSGGSAGAWSNTTTSVPVKHLIIDQLDDGQGAAGGGAVQLVSGGLVS